MRDNNVGLNQNERSMVGVVTAPHPGETSPKLVMRRLLPTLAAIVIALLAVIGMTLYHQHRRQLSEQIAANISNLSGNLHLALEQQTSGLTMTAQLIVANATVQKALRAGDADRLLADWLPVFETLHREKNLTHFYFLDANRVCLLRVHKPEKSGDRIERFTALEAERTGKTASGIELGPLGTYTLRVVQPIFEGGALVGYVELGKEIEDVLRSIKTHSGDQLAVVIRKMYLNRQTWEEGMQLLGREADWDRLPRSVVSYASQGRLPDPFASWADLFADDHSHGEFQEIACNGKDWGVSATPLPDASGKGVGDLLILIDVSSPKSAFARIVVLGGTAGTVLLAVLLSLIYVQLSRTDATICIQKARIREREESYRNQFYNNIVVMLLIDPQNGAIIDANNAALRFYGYSRERMLAMFITDINVLATSEVRDAMASVPQGGGKQFEFQHRLADGSLRDVEVSTSSVHFDGRLVLNSIIHDITSRKQAQDALKHSLSLLSASLESTGDGILIVDTQGKITRWNQKFAEMWNIPKEVLFSHDDEKVINCILAHLAYPEQFIAKVRELYAQPELSSLDLIEFADGRFFERYSQPQKIMDIIVGRVWSFRDITERKQTEDLLRANRKQLTDVIEFLPDATFVIDKERRVIIWNDAIENMTGIPAAKMIGSGAYSYTKPFYGEARPMLIDLIFENGNEIADHYPHIISEGDTLVSEVYCNALYGNKGAWVFAKASPLRDQSGQVIGAIESIRDITDNKRAEDKLRESVDWFKALFNATSDSVILVDPDGRILDLNQHAASRRGVDTGAMRGQNLFDFLPSEAATMRRTAIAQILSERRLVQYDEARGEKYYRIRLYPVTCDQNTVYMVASFSRDITERKQAEEAMAKLEAQYKQAQKMESVGQLAGGVAHDFNNMLGVILGRTELAMNQLEPSHPIFDDLEEIRNAANRSADITKQLLAFARKQTIVPKVLDLNKTVERMLKMLRRLLGENIDLAWLPEMDLWPIKMDPAQIDQILANLLVNARDAIVGVGKITVETGNRTFGEEYFDTHAGFVAGEYVRISVSDNGRGMDKETLARIFEPFFTTKGIGEGTGLGLATVYGAVKQNNGFIYTYSELGQGTTFAIYLPRYTGNTGHVRTAKVVEMILSGTETILLVEDEPSTLKMVTIMLQQQGYTVLTAQTPGEAIDMIKERNCDIDLLLTDVIMPGMNGRDLAEKLHTLYPRLNHLFMSGYTANVIAHQGILDTGVHFIQKPFTQNELATKVRLALEGKQDQVATTTVP